MEARPLRTRVGPHCGGIQLGGRIYFQFNLARRSVIHGALKKCFAGFIFVSNIVIHLLRPRPRHRDRTSLLSLAGNSVWPAAPLIDRGRPRAGPARARHRHFIRRVTRQFLRRCRLAGFLNRRRDFRLGHSARTFQRRFRWLSGLDRRIFLRIDAHLHRHLAVVAELRPSAGHRRGRHLDVTDDRASAIPELGILGHDL